MTNSDLIQRLQNYPGEAEVYVQMEGRVGFLEKLEAVIVEKVYNPFSWPSSPIEQGRIETQIFLINNEPNPNAPANIVTLDDFDI